MVLFAIEVVWRILCFFLFLVAEVVKAGILFIIFIVVSFALGMAATKALTKAAVCVRRWWACRSTGGINVTAGAESTDGLQWEETAGDLEWEERVDEVPVNNIIDQVGAEWVGSR